MHITYKEFARHTVLKRGKLPDASAKQARTTATPGAEATGVICQQNGPGTQRGSCSYPRNSNAVFVPQIAG